MNTASTTRQDRSKRIPSESAASSLWVGVLGSWLLSLTAAGCKGAVTPDSSQARPTAISNQHPPDCDPLLRSLRLDDPQWSPAKLTPGARAELWLELSFPVLTSEEEEKLPFVAYPTVLLMTNDPRVKIRGGGPSVYGLSPGMGCQSRFEIDFDPGIPVGTVIPFRATPSTIHRTDAEDCPACSFDFDVRLN